MAIFSFHPVKSITMGEGGAVLTNNKDLYGKLLMFRNHGIMKSHSKLRVKNQKLIGDWYYEMQELGFNYRITDFQCALGISQLKKLDKFIQRRREIASIYERGLKNNDYFNLPQEKNYAKSSWHLYPIRIKDKYKAKKREIFCKLREKGLGVQVHYIPVYRHPYYQNLGYGKNSCFNAENFYQREISIPIYPSMRDKDIKYVSDAIINVFKRIT
jgi:dTDP-4-amino-4,6-dideoxygalactose transaminase